MHITALEVRAMAAETRVDTAETLEIANKLLAESQAMKLSKSMTCSYLQTIDQLAV